MGVFWAGANKPDERDAIVKFVASRIWNDPGREFGKCVTMGVIGRDKLIAGLVFHNYSPEYETIELSGAADDSRWLTRAVFKEMFSYVFDQIGCQMLVARHSERNTHLRRMWKAVGATEYLIPRLRGRDEAEAVTTYTAETWRDGKIMRRMR